MSIIVIGGGYVGLTTAIIFAAKGHSVVCVEKSEDRLRHLLKGEVPFYEPGLDDLLKQVIESGNFQVTSDLVEAVVNAKAVFLAVGTPSLEDGSADLSQLQAAADQVGEALSNNQSHCCVVVKSTVLPGTTENVVKQAVLKYTKSGTVSFAMNPEFLRQGSAVNDALYPDRIVLGHEDKKGLEILREIYKPFDAPLIETAIQSAEMIKYTSNALLATLISFSNEIANICETVPGADVREVLDVVCMDRRITMNQDGAIYKPEITSYLKAGCGFGGSCLPKDVNALRSFATNNAVYAPLLDAVLSINKSRPTDLIKKLKLWYPDLAERSVGIIGITFKENTSDLRNSPGLSVVNELRNDGVTVNIWDPYLTDELRDSLQADSGSNFNDFLHKSKVYILTSNCLNHAELEQLYSLANHENGVSIIDGRGYLNKSSLGKNTNYYSPGVCAVA
jgi:UDPglucose 6-dehydrogenase